MNEEASTSAAYRFRPLRLEDRDAVETVRKRAGHTLSSHAFVSLFLWQAPLGLSFCLGRDAFFVRFRARGENAYFFPCGAEEEKEAFLRWLSARPSASLHYIRQEDCAFLDRCFPGRFALTDSRRDGEYLYCRAEQVEMKGGAYKNLRSKVHKARDRHTWTVAGLDASNLDKAATVAWQWQARRGSMDDMPVVQLALEHYEALGFRGVLLEDEAGPQAVAFGSIIAPDVFDLHVTKTLLPSLDSYLKWELYQRLPGSVVWIDQEEDLDLPGLRANKLESAPAGFIPLWKGVLV